MLFALYHSESETLGIIAPILKGMGIPHREVHLYAGDGLPRNTGDLDGLILMGGPMNVDDVTNFPFLLNELQLVEKVLADGKPVLGICLGAQLIAKALGARVYPNGQREVGWHPIERTESSASDGVFGDVPKSFDVLHWHGDTFDLPEGAVHLARSARCENQAFRWGKSAYGLQFHLEATPAMVRQWMKSPEDTEYVLRAGEDPATLVHASQKKFEKLEPVSRKIFTSYLTHAIVPNPLLAVR